MALKLDTINVLAIARESLCPPPSLVYLLHVHEDIAYVGLGVAVEASSTVLTL